MLSSEASPHGQLERRRHSCPSLGAMEALAGPETPGSQLDVKQRDPVDPKQLHAGALCCAKPLGRFVAISAADRLATKAIECRASACIGSF